MLKKLMSLLFGKKEITVAPAPLFIPEISIHDEIKKTLEEIEEKKQDTPFEKEVKIEKKKVSKKEKAPKDKKEVKSVKTKEVKKTSAKKKIDVPVSVGKAKKVSKKSK